MKKNLLKTLATLTICSSALIAQPTLNSNGINPIVGDVYILKQGNFVSPGTAGANQTWNLSGLVSTSTASYTSTNPSSTPYAASFTNSNFSMYNAAGGVYVYNNTSASAWQSTGAYGNGVLFAYSNPEDLLHYPFNMGNTYTDPWAVNFVSGGMNFARTGTTTVTYDGYGTLILPNGTFSNAVRVHFYQSFQDVYTFASTTNTITYTNDEYMWYLNGNHQTIAAVYTSENSTAPGQLQQNGFYVNSIVSSVNEYDNVSSNIISYPNPASDEITFNFINNTELKEIQVYSITGKLLLTEKVNHIESQNGLNIKLNDFSNGIYLVKFISIDGSTGTKKITIKK